MELRCMLMSVGIGFAGAAWAAGGAADVPASVAEGKDFGCGAKCPMQGWMKTVMQSATTSGDGAKIASALDIDGAKASCKACHDLEYKAKLRDAAF
ncbi:hypothetical protein BE20_09890 [Sorangium cellulosum]|nr:hypothetical protein BE20_09890 [Sorangium cellulosum]